MIADKKVASDEPPRYLFNVILSDTFGADVQNFSTWLDNVNYEIMLCTQHHLVFPLKIFWQKILVKQNLVNQL